MKRRLKILLGTFGVIISAFLLYYLVSDKDFSSAWRGGAPATRPADEDVSPVPGLGDVGPVRGFKYWEHDKHHRLQAKYTSKRSEKVGEKLYLTDPKVEFYLRDGEVITIEAEHGVIIASEAAGKWNVRSGLLRDKEKIQITIDRSRNVDPDRPPLEQRPEDAVIIHVHDEVNFDNEMLTILSDGRVSVHSKEADIFGKGLRIAWNEAPRQLRELRIAHGDHMVIREGQGQFISRMSLPGGAETNKNTPTKPESESAEPSTRPSAETKESVARAETPTTLPTTMPTTVPAGPAPVIEDAYVVTFNDNVLVTSGTQRMTGADKLRLVFEFKSPDRDERQSNTRSAKEKKTTTSGPAPKIATSKPSDVLVKTPTTKPADEMVITWTGPLVVKPFRSYEKPIPKRFDVTATGKKLTLSDGKATAVCRKLEFRSPGRGGMLIGTPDEPVKLKMASGENITVPKIRFNRFNNDTTVVYLDGAGEMHLPENAAASLNLAGADDEQPEKKKGEAVTIRWTEKVEALLGRREVKTETGVENEDFLRWAVFVGKVNVQQGETQSLKTDKLTARFHQPASSDEKANRMASLYADGNVNMNDTKSGEYIKSQTLDVQMSGPDEEKAYARKVVATGDVSAMQEKREINASESMTITFAPQKDKKTGKIEIKPQQLDAVGDVRIIDRSEKDVVFINAETLTSDLSAKTATLKGKGKPATVRQKDNIIRGRKILFDQAKESANVAGAGSLRFYTDTDISGNKSDKPRPMDIAWDDEMDYQGKERTAIITGAVNLKMSGDELKCGKMTVIFTEPEDDVTTRLAAETKPAEFVSFRPQKIKTVTAEKKVRMESQRADKDGFLLQRVRLRSERVIYNVDLGVLQCPQAGTLSAEDYRPPEKKKAGRQRDDLAGSIDRPSQSAFRWSKSMTMNQTSRTVVMTGKVRMVHRSGGNVVLAKKLNVRPWGKLPEGRNTVLDCEKMNAQFAAPDKTDAASASGPAVGALNLFDATGDVNLEDGPRQIFCQRILYQRKPADTAIIWGSLPGEPKKNAIMYYRDVQRGVLNSWKNPQLIWYRATNRVVGKGVEVRGGR